MNKIRQKLVLSISVLSIFAAQINASTLIPLGIKPFDFIYNKFEKYETIQQDNYLYSVAPYVFSKDSTSIAPLSFLHNNSVNRIHLFFIGNESYSTQSLNTNNALETIRAGITAKFSDNIFLYSNIILDEQKAEDSSYTGKKWNGLAGGVEQSFISANYNHISFSIGRFKSFWGIQKSLVLSESNSLDGFQYTLNYKKLSLTYRFAKLNQLQLDLSTTEFDNRYFAGHRLDLRLHKKLRVGLFESIIFGGIGRTVEFNYLNPLLSYHVEQLNNNVNDNSFIGFDFTYYPFDKSKLYGQVLIDDFQIDNETQGDQEPNQYGMIIGSYFVDIVKSYDLRLEYIRITNRTFNQAQKRNRYIFENKAISYFNSNDFDKFNFSLSKWISSKQNLSFLYSYKRKGEGNINDPWSEPWLDVNSTYSEPFPFGIVEKTNRFSGQFKGFIFKNFYLEAIFGIENIKNMNNIVQKSQQNKFISITLFTFFSEVM